MWRFADCQVPFCICTSPCHCKRLTGWCTQQLQKPIRVCQGHCDSVEDDGNCRPENNPRPVPHVIHVEIHPKGCLKRQVQRAAYV